MKRYRITLKDKIYDVEVGDLGGPQVQVIVDGETFTVDVEQVLGELTATLATPAASAPPVAPPPEGPAQAAPGEVTAPMPGVAMDIAAQPGDTISVGQRLCNLEAMKMKSPIRSPVAGRVIEVRVAEGQSVQFGDVLFVVE